LGQFEGNTLRSLMYATFNSRSGPTTTTWTEAGICETQATAGGLNTFGWVTQPEAGVLSRYRLKQCVRARAVRHTPTPEFWRGELADTVLAHLQQMNAVPADTTAMRSELIITDAMSANLMMVLRLDFGAPSAEKATRATNALDLSLQARETWMKAYAPLATQGMTWSLELPTLTGQPTITGKAASMPN
jgi:hypothetical protein